MIGLVGLDASLKVLAVLLLESDRVIGASPKLQLMLRINRSGFGSFGKAAFSGASSIFLWKSIFALVAVNATLILTRKLHRGVLFLLLACLGASVAGSLVGELMVMLLGTPSDALIVPCMRLAQSALWITAWHLTEARVWRLGFLLLAASALGNLLSLAYPPYAIVDYLYSEPLFRLSGMQVINLADAMYLAAMPTLAVAAVLSLVNRRLKQRGNCADGSESDEFEDDENHETSTT